MLVLISHNNVPLPSPQGKPLYPTRRLQGLQYEGAAGAERMVSVALANRHDFKGVRGAGRLV